MTPYLSWSPGGSDVTYGQHSWLSGWNVPSEKALRDQPPFLEIYELKRRAHGSFWVWASPTVARAAVYVSGKFSRPAGQEVWPCLGSITLPAGTELSGDIMASPAESPLGSGGL